MTRLSARQWLLLVMLTLVWGVNWPVMKLGVTHFPTLSFRAMSMWLGLPILFALVLIGVASASVLWPRRVVLGTQPAR